LGQGLSSSTGTNRLNPCLLYLRFQACQSLAGRITHKRPRADARLMYGATIWMKALIVGAHLPTSGRLLPSQRSQSLMGRWRVMIRTRFFGLALTSLLVLAMTSGVTPTSAWPSSSVMATTTRPLYCRTPPTTPAQSVPCFASWVSISSMPSLISA
jgi:hypothetical protein